MSAPEHCTVSDTTSLWQSMSRAHDLSPALSEEAAPSGDAAAPAVPPRPFAGTAAVQRPVRTTTEVHSEYRGTLPDPDRLAAYEEAAPGITAELLAEDRARRADRYRTIRLVAALGLAVTTIITGQWALLHGASTEALYLTGGGLAGLAATFLRA